jgi:hypothetical protein
MAVPMAAVGSLHFTKAPLSCNLRHWPAQRLLTPAHGGGGATHDVSQRYDQEPAGPIEDRGAGQTEADRWSTPWGTFWAPKDTSFPYLLGEQVIRTYGDGPRRVQPGDVVIDRGANIGTFTREALLAGAAKVVSVEPSAENVECLRRNFT